MFRALKREYLKSSQRAETASKTVCEREQIYLAVSTTYCKIQYMPANYVAFFVKLLYPINLYNMRNKYADFLKKLI